MFSLKSVSCLDLAIYVETDERSKRPRMGMPRLTADYLFSCNASTRLCCLFLYEDTTVFVKIDTCLHLLDELKVIFLSIRFCL